MCGSRTPRQKQSVSNASRLTPMVARLTLVKAFRKRMQFLRAAKTEQDLRNWKALHFEKLKGQRKDERSVRLNDQWRLILKLEQATNGPQIVVVGITDYH